MLNLMVLAPKLCGPDQLKIAIIGVLRSLQMLPNKVGILNMFCTLA